MTESRVFFGIERPLEGTSAKEYLDINRVFLLPMPFEDPLYVGCTLFQAFQIWAHIRTCSYTIHGL
jgi:hypothetical protein